MSRRFVPAVPAILALAALGGARPLAAEAPTVQPTPPAPSALSSPPPPASVSGNRHVTTAFGAVYMIKTAIDATAPKASYGSCFVVDPKGLLATNYHVVSSALLDPDKYNLYLIDGEQTLPAEVVAIDVVNDLAVFRVDRTFPKAIKVSKALPESGAKIYSIGWPADLNKSVIEGNVNGLTAPGGPYQKLQMSIPLNPGMSGGPTINEAGELIGINVSMRADSQSLAFAVPVRLLTALLTKPPASYGHPSKMAAFDEEVRSQLDAVQEQLAGTVLKGRPATVAIGGWQAEKPASLLKCWREQESGGPGELTTVTTETCYLPGASPVRHDMDAGTIRVKFQAIESPKLSNWQYLTQVNDALGQFGFFLAEAVDKVTTPFKCGEMDVVNGRHVPLRAHYCVSAFVRYPEVYNVEFEAVTLTKEKSALLVAASLLGFSSRNATEITRALVNSIRPESAE